MVMDNELDPGWSIPIPNTGRGDSSGPRPKRQDRTRPALFRRRGGAARVRPR
jgi:hypothetical protein